MVPEYQTGYVDYIYQTDDPAVQDRRIKYMSKLFQFWQKKPWFYILPSSKEANAQMIKDWNYGGPDSSPIYYASPWIFPIKGNQKNWFRLVRNGIVIAIFKLEIISHTIMVHLFLEPGNDQLFTMDLIKGIEGKAREIAAGKDLVFQLHVSKVEAKELLLEAGFELIPKLISEPTWIHLAKIGI